MARTPEQTFLWIFRCQDSGTTGEDDIVYGRLYEPALDWIVIATPAKKLNTLEICVLEELIQASTSLLGTMAISRQKYCRPDKY